MDYELPEHTAHWKRYSVYVTCLNDWPDLEQLLAVSERSGQLQGRAYRLEVVALRSHGTLLGLSKKREPMSS